MAISFSIPTNLAVAGTLTVGGTATVASTLTLSSTTASSLLYGNASKEVSSVALSSNLSLTTGTLALAAALTGINSVTAASGQDAVFQGGSSGASLVLGQGGRGGIFLSPNGTGKVGVGTVAPISTVTIGDAGGVIGAVDAQMTIARYVDDSTAGNGHGFTDASVISRGGGMAYNSYDTGVLFSGTNNYDHFTAFQSSITYSSSGTLSEYRGLTSNLVTTAGTVTSAYGAVTAMTIGGTVGTAYGLLVNNPTGAGGLTNNYGVYITELTKGSGSKYSIFAAGDTYSRFGNLEMGSVSASPTVRKVIKFNDGGYADPAAPGSTSSGDKLIFQDPGSSYRSVIGFNGSGHTWFQGSAFAWWTGAAPTNVMSLSAGGALTTTSYHDASGGVGTPVAGHAQYGGSGSYGASIIGNGSAYDFGLFNKSGTDVMHVATGGTTVAFAGAIYAADDISIIGTAATDRTLKIQSLGAQYAQLKMNTNSSTANNFQVLVESGGRIYFQQNNGAINTLQIESTGHATYSKRWNVSDTTDSTSTTTGSIVTAGGIGVMKNLYVGGVIVRKNYTVATLPAAASYTYGTAFVSDATNAAGTGAGTAPTGGGAVVRLVYCTGAAWLLV